MEALLYLDPSHRGDWALAMAAQLPASLVDRLVLLATTEDVARHRGLVARARQRLAGGVASVEESLRPGPAEAAVTAEMRSRSFGLVIVPPAGRNAIQRMIRGSRIATVVRNVPSSVLVARRPPERIERVLAAVSGGPLTPHVVGAALELAAAFSARPTFLHVASEVALPFHEQSEAPPPPGPDEAVERVRALLRKAGSAADVLVREGLVVDEVIGEMEDGAHHFLILGAPTAAAPSWASDDLTERILLECPAPILVVKGALRP